MISLHCLAVIVAVCIFFIVKVKRVWYRFYIPSSLGTTILLVEQNARLALKFAQRGYVLETGQLVLQGAADELLNNPEAKKAYLGA